MDQITHRDLEYIESLFGSLSPVFAKMDAEGGKESIPIVSTSVGRALFVLVRATAAKRIVEVGTAIGYSALWMALALPKDGRIVTIDPDRERTDRARRFWQEAGVSQKVDVVNGRGLEELPRLRGPFDLAFIDALKSEYDGYLERILPLLRPGGTIAVDNVLWSGRASGANPVAHGDTEAIRAFNRKFANHPSLDSTILPVGDGLALGVKR
jgi:caffeoyl-CoA O-methyltransferase